MRTHTWASARLTAALVGAVTLALAPLRDAHAQQAETSTSLGIRGGVTTYYGELNDELFPATPELRNLGDNLDYLSWGVDLERYFGNGWGVGLLYTNSRFTASDREIDWDGNFELDADDFSRALNVSTSINDLAVYGMWSANDGRVLSETAFLSPFFKLGAGVTRFETSADLLSAGGQRYRYDDTGAGVSVVDDEGNLTALPGGLDGVYETELRDLRTNGNSRYNKYAYHVLGGVGLNFRFSEHFALQLETIARFTTTDNLDDVSGDFQTSGSDFAQYASNPGDLDPNSTRGEDGNDAYATTMLTARFYFGDRSESFRTPFIVLGDLPLERPDTADATSRLFRFEAPAPLDPTPIDSFVPEPIVYRPQGAMTVPRPGDRAANADPDGPANVPAVEDMAAADFEATQFDPADFGVLDTASTVDSATAAAVVTEYPEWATDEQLALDEGLTGRVDSLAALDPLDSTATAQLDSLAMRDSIDVFTDLSEPADRLPDSLVQLRADSVNAASLATADSVNAAIDLTTESIDSLERELTAAPPTDSTELLALRAQIDSLEQRRARDERFREDVERQRRAELARLTRDEDNRRAQPISQPRGEVVDRRELTARTADERNERMLRRMAEEQAELRRQVAQLSQQLTRVRGAQPVAAPAIAPAPTAQPLAPAVAGSGTSPEVLAELRALRQEIAALQAAPTQAAPTQAAPSQLAPSVSAPVAPPVSRATPTAASADPRVQVLETLSRQEVRRVFFEIGQANIEAAALNALDEIAAIAKQYPAYVVVQLEGFTDKTGSQELNQRLSERRVRAVRNALEQLGVPASQVQIQAQGEDFDASDLSYGRRVEVRLAVR